IVEESLMVVPKVTVSIETLVESIQVFRELYELAGKDPDSLHEAPVTTPVTRLDEVGAARHPVLRYRPEESGT
ncbi:MAG: aminomethyl-transferring glycine dehydrogenase subunit GcvPB, partial [[Clostridium] scindens]